MIRLDSYDNDSFNRGVSKLFELTWMFTRAFVFLHSFPVPSKLKVVALRFFGATVGKGVVIRSRVNISMPWRLALGDFVWLGDDVSILSLADVRIGSNCCISQRVFLCTGSHNFASETFDLEVNPITLEESCWVGAQCFVGPGVIMAQGSRCLAGAVLIRNTKPGTTVGGVPAKVIAQPSALVQE